MTSIGDLMLEFDDEPVQVVKEDIQQRKVSTGFHYQEQRHQAGKHETKSATRHPKMSEKSSDHETELTNSQGSEFDDLNESKKRDLNHFQKSFTDVVKQSVQDEVALVMGHMPKAILYRENVSFAKESQVRNGNDKL